MPLAAQYSTPETKGKNVGIILSGLLTGILASRVVSGIVGEYLGWPGLSTSLPRVDGRLFAYYNKDTPGPSFQLSGKLCRTDEILVFHRQEVSPTPHSFVACRFLVRIVPCHVELSGFQDGAGAFLCGKSIS